MKWWEKYEITIVLLIGMMIGIIFMGTFGGEFSRGKVEGMALAQDKWNGLLVDQMRAKK